MKARTSTKKRGRPKKLDAIRTESGQISRSLSQFERDAISWKRMRDNPGIEPEKLRAPEYGSMVHVYHRLSEGAQKRNPEAPGFVFTAQHLDTANRLHEAYIAWRMAMGTKAPRSSTEFGGAGGHDNLDPFDADRARRDQLALARFKDARRAILESCPLGMMAVEAIVFNNQDCPNMLADLRLALNAVDRLWRMARAA